MSRSIVNHLERAKGFIGKGEDYYRRAAEEIVAARKADFHLSYREIGAAIGRSGTWCRSLVKWSEEPGAASPFGGKASVARRERHQRRTVEDVLHEQPEAVVQAICQASDAIQQEVANGLVAHGAKSPRTPKSAQRRLQEVVVELRKTQEQLQNDQLSSDGLSGMTMSASDAYRLTKEILRLLEPQFDVERRAFEYTVALGRQVAA